MTRLVRILLVFAIFATSLKTVTSQHDARRHFTEIEELEAVRNRLDDEWGRLQLEQSAWTAHERLERLARRELGMKDPDNDSLVIVLK